MRNLPSFAHVVLSNEGSTPVRFPSPENGPNTPNVSLLLLSPRLGDMSFDPLLSPHPSDHLTVHPEQLVPGSG
jgi:hypothetical protein